MPKCENSIWTQLPARTRASDAKLKITKRILLAAINCQLEVTNGLSALDWLTFSLTANYEMNQRRPAVKPKFKAEIAKGFAMLLTRLTNSCSEGTHPNEWRQFLSSRRARCAKARALQVLVGGIVLLYSRWYRSGRGRGACTSTYTSQSCYQKPKVNKKPTKAPNNWYVNNSKLLDVNAQKPFVAGRTNQCLSEWVKLTTDPEVLDIVKHCHIEFSQDPCLFSIHGQRNFFLDNKLLLTRRLISFLI